MTGIVIVTSIYTDGGKVVGLTRWLVFTPNKIRRIHFC
jgi:hypothetical protein